MPKNHGNTKNFWIILMVAIFLATIVVASYIDWNVNARGDNGFPFESILYVGGTGSGNYSNIQDAIDNASDGDTVFVYNGTYYENVVLNKSINLAGENRNTTIIDANGTGDVVNITADRVNISGFTIRNGSDGIDVDSNFNNITGNNISSNNYLGIYLSSSSKNNTILGNDISNNYAGMGLNYSSDNTILSNNISNNGGGIVLSSSSNNNILGNAISSNDDEGIWLDSSSDNAISGNNISSNNDEGIYLYLSSNNTILGNTINSNDDEGLYLYFSSDNNILSNNVSNNDEGIYLYLSSDNNLLYHNNFINNTQNAHDECSNIWDYGYPFGGNYWDDYDGADSNGDGIGDTSYNISGNSNQDEYPLMYPITSPPLFVWVYDNFNSFTPGWGHDHFDKIQNGIDAVAGSNVYVFNGTYNENVVVNKTINLIGEDRNTTIIDANGTGNAVNVTVERVNISNFGIRNSSSYGIHLSSSNNAILNCNVSKNKDGIYIKDSSNDMVGRCNCYNNSHSGIWLDNSLNISIEKCNFYDDRKGIWIHDSFSHVVECDFSGNREGICLDGSSRNVIKNCSFNDSYSASIWLDSSNKNNITSCNFSNASRGVYLFLSSRNNIRNCNFTQNSYGIWFQSSSNINVTQCNFRNNAYGISLSSSSNNSFYHNNFINNTQNAYDECSNYWDNGYPSGGNYWNDYIGTDADGDGIGDIPYNISGGSNQDRYPLMFPWGENPPVANFTYSSINKTATFNASSSYDRDGNIVNYTWDFGDGTNGTGMFISHNYSTEGSYDVTLTVIDNDGKNNTIFKNVLIENIPPTSNVNPISPYWRTSVPFTITVTANDTGDIGSGVATVELFYRYSTDNSSWDDWTSFGVDDKAPWSWSFIGSDGYYEFYSIAIDTLGNVESSPAKADAMAGVDTTDPTVNIEKPKEGYLYVFNIEIISLPSDKTVIIGLMTIEVDASDGTSGIDRVEFYIDINENPDPIYIDTSAPYKWLWDETIFFDHSIKVIAYDKAGNTESDEIEVLIFNITY